MPEIKNTFIQGKMNKDLDERLIPNGQYRNALNVEVSTSEGSDVGTVKNILGNQRAENLVGSDFKCVGSVADEKNNKLYWFISKYNVDAILEYDANNNISKYVLVDTYAGTEKAVLKFFGNVITGINIIDNLLFWTDNQGEPKKINIDTCKAGTTSIENHTQLSFENGSFYGITVKLTAVSRSSPNYSTEGRFVWFDESQILKLFLEESDGDAFEFNRHKYGGGVGLPYFIRHYRNGEFLGIKRVRVDGGRASDGGGASNGSYLRVGPNYNDSTSKDFKVGDVIFGNNVTVDISEKHITVIKPKPLNALTVKINHAESAQSTSKIPNLFETKLPRFSYRYKYTDGEYSTFAPFTEPVFNAKYTKDTSKSIDGGVMYNQDTAYDIKEPYNKAMVNAIHSVDLTNFITAQTPEDVVEIDILYKQENSSVIYSIETIKHIDKEWHSSSGYEGLGTNIGIGKAPNPIIGGDGQYSAIGGQTKGVYVVTTENIYAALPANQLLRPWDNVPRKALAQEVTGNRIVYGNYLQNYNIGSKPQVQVSYSNRQNRLGTFESKGLPSIKSQRNYQLGVVYCDKYGRETPVFTSNGGAVNIPWQDSSGNKNASKSTQLTVGAVNNFPEWVDSLKFFVKETSSEYYNLTMERAWVTKSTYALDNSEGHLYISFPSSDRNKISEEDYIILKKKIGVGEEQVTFENKFRVIDIKNEAPDAIKYDLVNQGAITNTSDFFTLPSTAGSNRLFYNATYRIDKETDNIHINHDSWKGENGYRIPLEDINSDNGSEELPINTKDLYMSWRYEDENGNEQSSSRYKITGGGKFSIAYVVTLERKITEKDAAIAAHATDSTKLKDGLIFQIEKKELKDTENFSGKFFVKISKNQVSSIVETGEEVSNLDKYQVTAKQGVWCWQDVMATSGSAVVNTGGGDYGNTNNYGFRQTYSSSQNSIRDEDNNGVGTSGGALAELGSATNDALRLTDYWVPWSKILENLNGKPRFFVDAMYMVAGQSEASDYAKYCCVTWSGCTQNDNGDTAENSAWSYPPIKTWLSEFGETTNLTVPSTTTSGTASQAQQVVNVANGLPAIPDITIPSQAVWYENNLISTSPILNENADYEGLKIDGWVGPLQNVSRDLLVSGTSTINDNHINGLEGLVTTNEYHATGPRRWFSGLNGSDYGVGDDTRTYSDNGEEERHFMHLSFFAPGKDLHDGTWTYGAGLGGNSIGRALYNETGFMAHLQGIWGGGVFTGEDPNQVFGTSSDHTHLAMEGNYDDVGSYLPEPPGPGVGFGYDLDYRELHERQWDPTFSHDDAGLLVGDPGNTIRDFIRNLYPGSKFRFNKANNGSFIQIDDAVYTIKKVTIKKLYNHTSWRKPYNRYIDTQGYNVQDQNLAYRSVEKVALDYLDQLNSTGNSTGGASYSDDLKEKIEQFGANHNRRLCYIIELDKNPAFSNSTMGNPLDMTDGGASGMCGDLTNSDFNDVEFLDPVQDLLLSDLSKFPAIWEVDPKKQDVDLDIYYEASSNIPVRINEKTNELFAPIGCKVEIINATPQQALNDVYLESWDGNTATFYPGFNRGDGGNEIDYTNTAFKFIREDGSYTVAEAGGQQLIGELTGIKSDFIFKEDVGSVIGAGLAWYNCFSFGNGLESNRIRDDFNEMFITNGVKASTTTQQTYEEERRSHGLIYSGIYNSNSGINDLNQFIMAEKITKDLNPTYGTIQKLFQRRISLIAFCEDRVIQIISNKDAIFNADGNPQLISSSNVLGDANPFVGDFGISKNPESFASESYRAYFTDKARGAVLRLSKDGLTPISKLGMHDWFRDNLPIYTSLIGTYDSYKENYNITLSNTYTENIIFNTAFGQGVGSSEVSSTQLNVVEDGIIGSGSTYKTTYNDPGFEASFLSTIGDYHFGNAGSVFTSKVTVTNHAEIPAGYFQQQSSEPVEQIANIDVEGEPFKSATYSSSLPDDGWWYDPRFKDSANYDIDLFGPNAYTYADAQKFSVIKRVVDGVSITESNPGPDFPTSNWPVYYDPSVEKLVGSYPFYATGGAATGFSRISKAITRTMPGNPGSDGSILFDRANPSNSYVEFKNIGGNSAGINATYTTNKFGTNNVNTTGLYHSSFFNGDEIHIQLSIICYVTLESSGNALYYGYNYIAPRIELWDGNTIVPDSSLLILPGSTYGGSNPYSDQQTISNDMGSDFENLTTGGAIPTSYTTAAISGNADYKAVGSRFSPSAAVTFPDTDLITGLSGGANISTVGVKRIVVGASFKFRDSDQQNPDGTPNFTITYDNDNNAQNGIEEVKVVSDLRVRVSNAKPRPTSGYEVGNSTNYSLRNALWEVESVLIKKGFGVTDPHEDPIQEIITFTNPDTGMVEQYTTDELSDPNTALGQNASFVDGQWILNYGDIEAYDSGGGTYQENIPSAKVDAWVEVQHGAVNEWVFNQSVGTSLGYATANTPQWITSRINSWFGNNNIGLSDSSGGYTWRIPPSTQAVGFQEYPFEGGQLGVNVLLQPPLNYLPANGGYSDYDPESIVYEDVENDYYRIKQDHTTSNTAFDIHCQLDPGHEYVVGDWYFIDIEYADNDSDSGNKDIDTSPRVGDRFGTQGSGGFNSHDGMVYIPGVADGGLFGPGMSGGDPVDRGNGVGLLTGAPGFAHVALVPIYRTEYSDDRWVLRAIYQVHPNSDVGDPSTGNGAHLDYFSLRFYNIKNDTLYVSKIISKKINYVNGTGTATNWDINLGNSTYDQLHTFSDGVYNPSTDDYSNVYFHGQKLCWENAYGDEDWSQKFQNVIPQTADTTPAQDPNWTLKFTVGQNPRTETAVGELGVAVSNSIGNSVNAGEFDGMVVKGLAVDLIGFYEITFAMNGAFNGGTTDWSIFHSSSPNSPYAAYEFNHYSGNYNTANSATFSEMIRFFNANPANPLSCNVSGITLTNQVQLFEGGTVSSWNFDGFEPTIDDYIVWLGDNDSASGRIQFQNCPTFDPSATGATEIVTANQLIDKPINRYEKYEISFTYKMADKVDNPGAGLLYMYYFNSQGYGFRINDIGDPSNPAIGSNSTGIYLPSNIEDIGGGVRKVTMVVEIGSSEAYPELLGQGVEALLNTFVIRRDASDAQNVTGWVDNISMKRSYAIELNDDEEPVYPETTVTFSEDVNGWTSFKSFVPEAGLSLSKKYFTLKDAALYQHYTPANHATAATAENYNTFYGEFEASTITAVLNAEPSVIKTFNTLNYEGSQAHVAKPAAATDQYGNSTITIDNAKAWSSGSDIDGWKVTEVKSDMDNGSLNSFVKKEGKWFGYIRGKHLVADTLDTSRFSVQGIGFASNIDGNFSSNGSGGGVGTSTNGTSGQLGGASQIDTSPLDAADLSFNDGTY